MVQLKAAQHTDSVCDIASLRRRLHKEWLVFYNNFNCYKKILILPPKAEDPTTLVKHLAI